MPTPLLKHKIDAIASVPLVPLYSTDASLAARDWQQPDSYASTQRVSSKIRPKAGSGRACPSRK